MPGLLHGDFAFYAVVEQKLYRVSTDEDRGIGVFARASYSPPDRNLIDYYADTGVEFVGLADGRCQAGYVNDRGHGRRPGLSGTTHFSFIRFEWS
jgi:hypothetical protein